MSESWVDEMEPPETDDEGGDESCVHVAVSISEPDGTFRTAQVHMTDPDEGELADGIVACTKGIAAQRGGGLLLELAQRASRW